MLALKYLLLATAIAMFATAAGLIAYQLWLTALSRRAKPEPGKEYESLPSRPVEWRRSVRLALLGLVPLLASLSIAVVPGGMAAVAVSQVSGTRTRTLYPGVHLVAPLMENLALYDTRDKIFTTSAGEEKRPQPAPANNKEEGKAAVFRVQAREGLPIGLAITVRYRLDAQRLAYIHDNLPQPVDTELVPPVVASAFREVAPNYTVREVFATRREEIRLRAAQLITQKLGADGILVKEVMLRDIQLPPEYAKGLEQLLLREQENDRMGVETDIQQKQVRIAELQAEAAKAQQVKQAEAMAQVRVLQAKGEADAMQYTLPLKEKQIQQSRLEAEARSEATIKNAEALARAKVIDSKAEQQRRDLLAESEATRIRVTSVADAERMRQEAVVLKQNPLLINKIIAERLSDKVQIMMVPTDGKFFFNDVLRSPFAGGSAAAADDPEQTPRRAMPEGAGSR